MIKEEYKDIIAFHPGYYLLDIIDELEMTQEEFAIRLGVSGKTVSQLLNGNTPLSNSLAMKISNMLGISVNTLLNLQKKYDEKLIEIDNIKKLDEQLEVVAMIDYSYFVKNNLLDRVSNKYDKVRKLCACLKVSDLNILRRRDLVASFRTSVSTVTDKNIVNANVWLQIAFNQGLAMNVNTYDEKKLKSYIHEIRSMTIQEPEIFLPRLQEIFNECGVAFVLLPALKNSGVNGVVKWYDEKVVLAINDHHKFADTFWFSLFHEIGHVFQKKKTKVIVNCEKIFPVCGNDVEEDANDYARNTLIPIKEYHEFLDENGKYISKMAVEKFSKKIGVHSGITVGRLQHDGKISYSALNDMREKYQIKI